MAGGMDAPLEKLDDPFPGFDPADFDSLIVEPEHEQTHTTASSDSQSDQPEEVDRSSLFNVGVRPLGKSGFIGVTFDRGKWQALLYSENKSQYLGRFNTKEEAALAYDKAAEMHSRQTGLKNKYVKLNYNFGSMDEGERAAAAAAVAWARQNPVAAAEAEAEAEQQAGSEAPHARHGISGEATKSSDAVREEASEIGLFRGEQKQKPLAGGRNKRRSESENRHLQYSTRGGCGLRRVHESECSEPAVSQFRKRNGSDRRSRISSGRVAATPPRSAYRKKAEEAVRRRGVHGQQAYQ